MRRTGIEPDLLGLKSPDANMLKLAVNPSENGVIPIRIQILDKL